MKDKSWRPAARCRECKALTWEVSFRGLRKLERPEHTESCAHPVGRLDLQQAVPLAVRKELYGTRMERPMSDAAVEFMAREILHHGVGSRDGQSAS